MHCKNCPTNITDKKQHKAQTNHNDYCDGIIEDVIEPAYRNQRVCFTCNGHWEKGDSSKGAFKDGQGIAVIRSEKKYEPSLFDKFKNMFRSWK